MRTAISRMAAQGWLEPTRVDAAPGYRATRRAIERLTEAASRIYRSGPEPWDGRWRLVFVDMPGHRGARTRLREELHYLGYAEHAPGVWVCPFDRPEADEVVGRAGGAARHGVAVELDPDPVGAWDLSALAAAYAAWPGLADDLLGRPTTGRRTRTRPLSRPGSDWSTSGGSSSSTTPACPRRCSPATGPASAAELFTSEAERLKPASDRFVARCLGV